MRSVTLALSALLLGLALPALAATPAVRVPQHQRFVLPNGVTVILMPRRDVPLIAFAAIVRGGAATDPVDKPGVAALLASLLEKGAGARDAFAFADAVEGAGGSFGSAADAEAIYIEGQFLARDRALAIELLADALMKPALAAAEFEKLRDRQIEFIKADKDSAPDSIIANYGRAFLFAGHPYARPVHGSERSLASITVEDARRYYRANFGAERLTLVFVGDLDPKWFRSTLQRAFSAWRPVVGARLATLPDTPRAGGRRVLLIDSPGSVQTYFWLGSRGVARRYPQRAELDIANTLYGGRFTSILSTELRIKSGLSYSASSAFMRGTVPGEFAIRSFTQTENTIKAIDLAIATLGTLREQGVSQAMLDSARSYVLGQYPMRFETASHWAAAMADLELYGLDRSYIEGYGPALAAARLPQTNAVIEQVFPRPEDLVLVLIGDAAKIREQVRKYGAVTEMDLSDPDFAPHG